LHARSGGTQAMRDSGLRNTVSRGMTLATASGMAAVMALVFVPALAALGFMFGTTRGNLTFGTGLAMMCFAMLAAGVFYGLFRMTRKWENEAP
jgi:hypothetical protein